MVLLAAFPSCSTALTGSEDVRVGAPVAHRVRARAGGADRLLRQHPGPAGRPRRRSRAASELLARVRAHRPGRLRAPGPPLREAGRGAAPGAATSTRTRSSRSCFASRTPRPRRRDLPRGLRSTPGTPSSISSCRPGRGPGRRLSGCWELATDLFDAHDGPAAARPARRPCWRSWRPIPDGAVSRAGPPLRRRSATRSLVEWNDTAAGYPSDGHPLRPVRRRPSARPGAVAVSRAEELTYARAGRTAPRAWRAPARSRRGPGRARGRRPATGAPT